jgi:hypothetical protein
MMPATATEAAAAAAAAALLCCCSCGSQPQPKTGNHQQVHVLPHIQSQPIPAVLAF